MQAPQGNTNRNGFQKITAIIRMKRLKDVECRLLAKGVTGLTVTLVKGFGEWHPESYFGYARAIDRLVEHVRIELFVEADRADALMDVIAQAAYTGDPGDGVIATLPVERFIHIRSRCGKLADAADASDSEKNER